MSTTAVSSSSIFQELQSFYQSRQTDLNQLGSALQSGDLKTAQSAFSALTTLGQDGPFANSEPFAKSSRAQAFDTLGQALQSGDLAGAQAAFATLTAQQSKSSSSTQETPATVVSLTSAQPTGTAATGPTASASASTQPTQADATSSIYQQIKSFDHQRKADLDQLGKDLQAGDLTAAQQDFTNLTTLGQTGPFKNGQTFQRADRAQDFQAIGSALQSGDLATAQSAFATLSATFGAQGPANGGPVPASTPLPVDKVTPPSVPAQQVQNVTPPSVPDQQVQKVTPPSVPDQQVQKVTPPSVPAQQVQNVTPPSVPDQQVQKVTPPSVPNQQVFKVPVPIVPDTTVLKAQGGPSPNHFHHHIHRGSAHQAYATGQQDPRRIASESSTAAKPSPVSVQA
jgi:hypothetical protein